MAQKASFRSLGVAGEFTLIAILIAVAIIGLLAITGKVPGIS